MKTIYLSLLFLLTILNISFAQDKKTGSISGEVIYASTKNPIPGITVLLVNTSKGTFTDARGNFKLEGIEPGVYAVEFSGVGVDKFVQSNVTVIPGKSRFIQVEMKEVDIILEGAEVRSSYFIKKSETVTSTQYLSAEDIRRAPGVQEDVIRATALLPGVNVTAAGRNDLIVRGGAPFENLFIVDNIEVPNINHFGSQGSTGGPLSLINLDYVKNVEFSAGGFGVNYGDKVSSLTQISLKEGNKNEFGGKVNLSATGFGASLEGPFSSGKGSYIFSARRSYLDFLFNAFGFGFVPEYWDFLGKVNYKINDFNNISFLTIGALDDLKLNNDSEDNRYSNSRVAAPSQDQYFSGLTWQHLFGNGFMNVTLGRNYSKFRTVQNDSLLNEVFANSSKEGENILKTNFDIKIGEKSDLQFGTQFKYSSMLDYDIYLRGYLRKDDQGIPREFDTDTTFSALKNSTFASYTTTFWHNKITFGGRMDYFDFLQDKFYFSPRLSNVFRINDVSAIIFSAGRYYQSPSYIWLLNSDPASLKPIRADQAVLGYEHTPLDDVKVQVEVYYKIYENYPARQWRPQAVLAPAGFDDLSTDIPFGLEPLLSIADGYSRGVELFIQKKLSNIPLYGLLSISISQSRFTSLDGVERAGTFDSRFIMNLAAGYRFNPEWELSGKFRLATGVPTTPFLDNGAIDFVNYNEGERLPLFHALDIRLDKRWNFSSYTIVTYLDIQNVYARENIQGVKWDQRNMAPEYQSSFGILPSIGVSLEF